MNATWIVSANAGRARFFSQSGPAARLEEVNDLVNTSARMDDAEIESDSLGQRAASGSRHGAGAPTTSSTYQPHQTPVQHETELFARDVARTLLQAHNEGRFDKLCLVASPEFLGVLRRLLDPTLGKAVRLEVNKDYTQLTPDELRERLHELARGRLH
ncbi:MAG: host attachment protein [Betaproteobacteria bacterium]